MSKKIAFIIGTRPEGIKLAPVINYAKKYFSDDIESIVIATGQHQELLTEVFSFFDIKPDFFFSIERKTNMLSELQASLTQSLENLFVTHKPDIVMVQGDTLSTLAGAMAAYYQQIPIAYIESGLRSGQLYAPFPEEANRLMVTKLAKWQFTPTQKATYALKQEGITEHVYEVGNTVVDAIQFAQAIGFSNDYSYHHWIDKKNKNRKMVLITIHRRENWETELENIILAVKTLSNTYKDHIDFVWISHANPNLAKKIRDRLTNISNIFIYPPANYPQLLHLMQHSFIILTDSGGIQEEAPSMNKPVLVARDVSERMEGVESGCAKLVGTKSNSIIDSVTELIEDKNVYLNMTGVKNPYGDGLSSKRILETLLAF
tara:strand:- start:1758 stop:2879 length:1122 start_codon:yes stop_codon:yes gene_type:complete